MSVSNLNDAIERSQISLRDFDRSQHILKVEGSAFKYISCQDKSQAHPKSDLRKVVSYINQYCTDLEVDYPELQDAINKVNDAVRSYNQKHNKKIFKVFSQEIANAKQLTEDITKVPTAMQNQAVLVKAIEKIEDDQDLQIVLELVTSLRAHTDGPLPQVKEDDNGKNALQALLEVPDLDESGTLFAAVVGGFDEGEIRDSQLLIRALLQKKIKLVEILLSDELPVDFSVRHHGKPAFKVARDCGFSLAYQVLLNPERTQTEILEAINDPSTPAYLVKFLIANLTQKNKIAFYRSNPLRLKKRTEEPKAIKGVRQAIVVLSQKSKFPDWALESKFLSQALAAVECEQDFKEIVLFCKKLKKTQLKEFVDNGHALHILASMPTALTQYAEVRDMLFDRVTDLNVEDNQGKSILYYALVSDNGSLILKLYDKQAAFPSKMLFDALQGVETVEGYQAILTLLNQNLLDIDYEDAGNTLLHAIAKLSPEIADARELIEKLKNINLSRNAVGKSPIEVAFKHKRRDVLKALLAKDHPFAHVEIKFLFDVLQRVQSAEDVDMMLEMVDRAPGNVKSHVENGQTLLQAALDLDPNTPNIARLLDAVSNGQNALQVAKDAGKLMHLEKLAEANPGLLQGVDVSTLDSQYRELQDHPRLHLFANLYEYILAGNAYAARPILDNLDDNSKNAIYGALYEAYIAKNPNATTSPTFGEDKFQAFIEAALVDQNLNDLMKRAIVNVLRQAYADPATKDIAKALLQRLHPEYQNLPLHFAVFLKDSALVDQEMGNRRDLHATDHKGRTAFTFAHEIGLEHPERLDPDQTFNALRAAFGLSAEPVVAVAPEPAPQPEPESAPAPQPEPESVSAPQPEPVSPAPSRFPVIGGVLHRFRAAGSTQPAPRRRTSLEALSDIREAIQNSAALPSGTSALYRAIEEYQTYLDGTKINGQEKWNEFALTNCSEPGFNSFISQAIEFHLFHLWRDGIASQDFGKLEELNALFSEEQKQAIYLAIETRERIYNPNASIDGRAKYEEFLGTRFTNQGFNNFILAAYSDLKRLQFPK